MTPARRPGPTAAFQRRTERTSQHAWPSLPQQGREYHGLSGLLSGLLRRFQYRHDVRYVPQPTRDASRHRRRDTQRPVNPDEVIGEVVERDSSPVGPQFPAESVRQPCVAPHARAKAPVGALDVARADVARVGVALYNLRRLIFSIRFTRRSSDSRLREQCCSLTTAERSRSFIHETLATDALSETRRRLVARLSSVLSRRKLQPELHGLLNRQRPPEATSQRRSSKWSNRVGPRA